MYTPTRAAPATADARRIPIDGDARRARARRRAMYVTAVVSIASFALLVDLLMANHTTGEEIWGPLTAAAGTLVGLLSLAYLAVRGRSRAARYLLYALWVMVAFFGFGGYNDHRLPRAADTVTDQRQRPPLAPLVFTGLGIAGVVVLRSGSKGK
jgi:peptidoglycan/LPS O-acetylase OafA/YrhL